MLVTYFARRSSLPRTYDNVEITKYRTSQAGPCCIEEVLFVHTRPRLEENARELLIAFV